MIRNKKKLLFVLSVGNIFTPKASFHNARCEILWKRLKRKGNARRRRGSGKQHLTGDIEVPIDQFIIARVSVIQQQKMELASEIRDEPEASDPMAVEGQVLHFSLL